MDARLVGGSAAGEPGMRKLPDGTRALQILG
jgi:hypothetical protein